VMGIYMTDYGPVKVGPKEEEILRTAMFRMPREADKKLAAHLDHAGRKLHEWVGHNA
jgi:hypothetical protein